jgi:hypothetical protein
MELSEYMPEPGVIETLFAVGEDGGFDGGADGGLEDPGGDGGGDGGDGDLGDGQGGDQSTEGAGADGQGEGDKADARYGPKEFREALKTFESTPEGAKFAKQVRADYYATQQLKQMEPGGLPAIREKYALIESVGGAEGLTTLQERVQQTDATDAALAAGDPKALEALGPDFDPGLAKLMPSILDRIMKADPEAYSAALLPHLMGGLMNSPMVGDLDRMIDVLDAPHLDEKGKIAAITKLLGNIGQWFKANEDRAGKLKTAGSDKGAGDIAEQRAQLDRETQTAHWDNKIAPRVTTYERTKLEDLFKPYAAKLKLDPAAKADLFDTFKARMKAAGEADPAYMKQMKIYRGQKNPDPATVANFVKSAINRHGKAVVDGVVKARYGRFIGGGAKPGVQQAGAKTGAAAGARGAAGTGAVTVVSVKPNPEEIDYRKTSEEDQWKKIYTLKDGRKVKWVKPAA